MATRQELIDLLERAALLEESVIPIYSKHVENSLFLSGFNEGARQRIATILKKLALDSSRHKQTMDGLLKKVKEADVHVY